MILKFIQWCSAFRVKILCFIVLTDMKTCSLCSQAVVVTFNVFIRELKRKASDLSLYEIKISQLLIISLFLRIFTEACRIIILLGVVNGQGADTDLTIRFYWPASDVTE